MSYPVLPRLSTNPMIKDYFLQLACMTAGGLIVLIGRALILYWHVFEFKYFLQDRKNIDRSVAGFALFALIQLLVVVQGEGILEFLKEIGGLYMPVYASGVVGASLILAFFQAKNILQRIFNG